MTSGSRARSALGPSADHAPLRDHVGVVGDGERVGCELLDEKNGEALPVEVAQDADQLFDDLAARGRARVRR